MHPFLLELGQFKLSTKHELKKFFNDVEQQDLKLKYYDLMVRKKA